MGDPEKVGSETEEELETEVETEAEDLENEVEEEADAAAAAATEVHDNRAENIAALRRARQAEAEARARAEDELAAARQALEAARRPAAEVVPADETPMEKWAREQSKVIVGNTEQSNRALAIALDTADRAEFYSRASINPRIAKYGPQVEEMLRKTRAAGGNAQRELIFKVILGEAVLKADEKGSGAKLKKAAAERVAEARGKSGSVRSNVGGSEKMTRLQQLEKKLEGKHG